MSDDLHKLLKELHAELEDAGQLDQSARQQLAELAGDIERALSDDNDESLPEQGARQLQEAAVDFESEHPSLAGVLRGIADTLVKLGI